MLARIGLALALALVTISPALAQEEPGFGIFNQRSNPSTRINSGNAGQLGLAWSVQTNHPVTHAALVVGNRVYFADWGGTVYAVDADTGRVLWQNQVEQPMMQWPWHGFAGTGAIANDFGENLLIEASVEGNAFGIDLDTGQVVWRTRITDQPNAGNLSTPLYHNGLVYLGLQSVEEPLTLQRQNFQPNFQGHVLALDAQTGEVVWDLPLVQPPHNGVAVWSSFALDPVTETLYFNTGNNYTGEPTELSDAMIAVDALTGDVLWVHQATQHDVWTPANPIGPDVDFGAGPQLFVATVAGQPRLLVGAGQKSGHYMAFDAQTGERIWDTVVGYAGVAGGIRGEASIGDGRILAWSNNSWDDTLKPLTPIIGEETAATEFPVDVKALDPVTGRYLWVQPLAQAAIGWAAGFLADDVYFVGSLDGTLKGYRASDGRVVANFKAPGSVGSALVAADDTLFVGIGVPQNFGGIANVAGLYAYRPGAQGGQPQGGQAGGGQTQGDQSQGGQTGGGQTRGGQMQGGQSQGTAGGGRMPMPSSTQAPGGY